MLVESEKPALLLVEDDEDDAYFFTRTLRQSGAGFAVHHLVNGSVAIEYLRSCLASGKLPAIIFLDLKLPVLNGFDVLIWMQKQTFRNLVPVIVLSGSEQRPDQERAQKLGAAEYLVKPIKASDFQRLVKKFGLDWSGPRPKTSGGHP